MLGGAFLSADGLYKLTSNPVLDIVAAKPEIPAAIVPSLLPTACAANPSGAPTTETIAISDTASMPSATTDKPAPTNPKPSDKVIALLVLALCAICVTDVVTAPNELVKPETPGKKAEVETNAATAFTSPPSFI
ncbi:MAG: hypothetical protein ACFNPX_06015 [Neisseria subflava]